MGPLAPGDGLEPPTCRLQRLPFFQLNYPGTVGVVILQRRPGSCNACSLNVAATVGRRLAVAIRAEHPQVFKAIVVLDAVDMVEVHVERLALPLCQPARLTAVGKNPGLHEARLDMCFDSCAGRRATRRSAFRNDAALIVAALDGICPRGRAKAESRLALPVAMAGIVVCLNSGPVVLASPIGKRRSAATQCASPYSLDSSRYA